MSSDQSERAITNKAATFEQINELCESFLKGWKKGLRPSLEAYLCKVSAQAQPTLMRNLLPIEIEYRRRNQESPSAQEYLRRLPKFATLIRQTFFMSTIQSQSDDQPVIRIAPRFEFQSAARHLGDYELIQQLGQGAFGIVYEARHASTGHRVALKLLPVDFDQTTPGMDFAEGASRQAAREGDRLHRFKREFRVLADMNHPNLVGLHNLEVDGGQWFFTMDLIEGDDFLSYIRPRNRLDETRLRAAMAQLVTGVLALHRQHVVHRDLKPTNVLVKPDGQVVILDFGLVAKLEATDQSGRFAKFHGTPAYAAPEQLTAAGTMASDWYAVGTILFEALTGDRPFSGNELDLLKVKQTTEPPSLLNRPEVPVDLATLCQRLLARDPANRPDATELAQRFESVPTTSSFQPDDRSQALIGRAEHLALLQSTLDSFGQNRMAVSIFISGKSGEGKTILAEQFLAPLRSDRRFTVLSGRCYDRESVPFKALDGVIDALASYWQALPNDQAANLLPDDIAFLAHLFPVLRRVAMVALSPRVNVAGFDRQQVRQRAFAALRYVISKLSSKTPVIIFCDDLQWGDEGSAEALVQLLRDPDSPAILLLGSYRSDESEGSRFMNAWKNVQELQQLQIPRRDVKLTPLSVEQCVNLLVDRVGIDNEAIRRRGAEFAEITDGNPYLMLELVGGFDPQTETFQALEMPDVVKRKLSRLPPDAEGLLHVIAVAGKALSFEEASRAADRPSSAIATITQMRNEHLVKTIEHAGGTLIDTYHDKIRNTVLESLPVSAASQIHQAIGEAIEKIEKVEFRELVKTFEPEQEGDSRAILTGRINDLAYHFEASGDTERALTYSLLAGEQAKSQFALEVAIEKFEVAKRNSSGASNPILYRLAMGLGESLHFVGRYDEAAEALTGAEQLSDDVLEQSAVLNIRAEIAYRHSSLLEAIDIYTKILAQLGITVPQSRLGTILATAREVLTRLSRNIPLVRRISSWLSGSRAMELDRRSAYSIQVLTQIVYPYFWRDSLRSFWACFKAFNLAENFHASPLLAAGHEQCANGYAVFLGMANRGEYHYQRALEIAEQVDDFVLQADVNRVWGLGRLCVGNFEGAQGRLQLAAHLYQTKLFDAARLTHTRYWIAIVNLYLGNLSEAARLARQIFELAVTLGLDRLAHQALETWTRAVGGNLPFEQYKSCFPMDREDYCATIQLLAAEAHWNLYFGRTEAAVEVATEAVGILRRNWLLHAHTGFAIRTYARALRLHADVLASSDSSQSRKLYRRALRAARWGIRLVRFARLEHSGFLREYSLALAALGKTKKALKYARKSCSIAEKQNAQFELAQSKLVCAELAKKLGYPESDRLLAMARTRLAEFEAMMNPAGSNTAPENPLDTGTVSNAVGNTIHD